MREIITMSHFLSIAKTYSEADPDSRCFKFSGKLRELNGNVGSAHQVEESSIGQLESLMNGTVSTPQQYETLRKILAWPKGL